MSVQQTGTLITSAKIDVSPDGIKISIEGLESDLAQLLFQAGKFTVEPTEYRTYDSMDVFITSDKAISFVDKPVVPPVE